MIVRLESFIRKARQWISPSEWTVRLLGLSRSPDEKTEPGLVMIQIDGLSRAQLETAIDNGRMPFLKRLREKEGYDLHTFYSGLPASTPAIQGELFYGVKSVVPAFSFKDRATGNVVRMFDPEPTASIEKVLQEKNPGLLQGGSSYANIFSGGAEESHFCPATFGWDHFTKSANPLSLIGFFLSQAFSLLRTGALLILEFVLAWTDCIRGLIDGRNLWKELKFVPTRVAISILLRDLVTLGASMDVARGLPIVHLNFIGYDEQAHRRGPGSKFAHWTLKGIDDSIRRIFNAARMSHRRDYDTWIYSDHGQEETLPYPVENGKSVHAAVAEVFKEFGLPPRMVKKDQRGIQFERSKWLGTSFLNWLVGDTENSDSQDNSRIVVTAMGSLGHLYTPEPLSPEDRDRLAERLVEEANIPLVLVPSNPGEAQGWTRAGLFNLPRDAKKILGNEHPFLEEAAQDLASLTHHRDAGDLIISGWRLGQTSISFPMENGSHTGPGAEETRGFALLPLTSPLAENPDKDYLRPLDLREAALHVLGRHPVPQPRFRRRRKNGLTLRIMTYNVHFCINMDGKISPNRIAKVIAHYDPDIVCLQELDVDRARTGWVDQAQVIAQQLEMEYHFAPAIHLEEGKYGNAILSRLPMRLVHAAPLPVIPDRPDIEPRGALWAVVTLEGQEIQLFNTHFGLRPQERLIQVEALLGEEWLGHPDCLGPVILCGDFNAQPRSRVCRKIRRRLHDAQWTLDDHRPQRTFFGHYPVGRIDHVFVSPGIRVRGIEVPRTALTRIASDHLPLIVEVDIANDQAGPQPTEKKQIKSNS